jgi:hypothetical protein
MNVSPLFVTHSQSAKLVQPSERPLHHPSPPAQSAAVFGISLHLAHCLYSSDDKKTSCTRIWSAEASAPSAEPKMLVRVATVRMLYPNCGFWMFPTGYKVGVVQNIKGLSQPGIVLPPSVESGSSSSASGRYRRNWDHKSGCAAAHRMCRLRKTQFAPSLR